MKAEGSRRILHCDMDCFYAAVHMRDDPSLLGKPVVIGGSPEGRGVVAAASYEARGFGVRSAMPASRAKRLCPQAVFLRSDFARYREESKRIFEILRSFSPVVQPVSIDEAYLDVTDHLQPYGSATAVAKSIRERVRSERSLTVSVGVGPNRLVAKIASDHDKPDGLVVVPPQRVLAFLAPLSVRSLQGVGPATEKVLREGFRVRTVAELREVPEAALVERLGRYGSVVFRYARGIDERPVVVEREPKSVSSERTYEHDLLSLEAIEAEIDRQARRLAETLTRKGLLASTVTVKVRYQDFETVTRSLTLETATDDPDRFSQIGRQLLRKTAAATRAVRLLGIGASKLEDASARPLQLPLS